MQTEKKLSLNQLKLIFIILQKLNLLKTILLQPNSRYLLIGEPQFLLSCWMCRVGTGSVVSSSGYPPGCEPFVYRESWLQHICSTLIKERKEGRAKVARSN